MRIRLGVLGAGLVLALAGCGVPMESEPRTLDPSVAVGTSEAPAADVSESPGTAVERLFLVRDNQLVAVERRLDTAPTLKRHLDDLVSGPTELEGDTGLGSALAGTDLILGVTLGHGTAVVELGGDTIRNDELLAYGQIVCTLAARDDVDAVRFVQHGRPLEVPRADGELTPEPLTAADYSALIALR